MEANGKETYQVRDTDTGTIVRWHSQWKQLRAWVAAENHCEGRARYTVEARTALAAAQGKS